MLLQQSTVVPCSQRCYLKERDQLAREQCSFSWRSKRFEALSD
jgi:hypothetical protein